MDTPAKRSRKPSVAQPGRQPQPWFWKRRGLWCVTIGGTRHTLAKAAGKKSTDKAAKERAEAAYHRLMAEALTFVNLVGNSVATIVVSRWEGALDVQALNERVGLRSAR